MDEQIEFIGGTGQELAGALYRPHNSPKGAVLLVHCFTCSKDLFTTTRIARGLASGGYLTMTFDFTGLGDSGGDFSQTSVTTNVRDVVHAAIALIQRGAGPCVLAGHSLGGAAAVLAAHRLRTVTSVVAVAAPASVGHVRNLIGAEALATLDHEETAAVEIGARPFRIGRTFVDDLETHDVLAAASALDRPFLVVQAGDDQVVGRDQTEALASAGGATVRTIDGADHLFTARSHSDALVQEITAWLDDTHEPPPPRQG